MQAQEFDGYVDRVENRKLIGWAWSSGAPAKRLSLDILLGTTLLGQVEANQFRGDLLSTGIGDGYYGFSFFLPELAMRQDENELRVRIAGTNYELNRAPVLRDLRKHLSLRYIVGNGVEIGALHNPLWIGENAKVKYVDRMPLDDLFKHYPEFKNTGVTSPDIVDDGEELETLPDESLDFVIINHFLEHCENPLGTMRNHMKKLKVGGILYCTIPDKRFFLDEPRPLTTFEHFVRDDQLGQMRPRMQHYFEWVKFWKPNTKAQDSGLLAVQMENSGYSIHFHVWDDNSFREFIALGQIYLDQCYKVETIEFNHTEIIAILRKIAPKP